MERIALAYFYLLCFCQHIISKFAIIPAPTFSKKVINVSSMLSPTKNRLQGCKLLAVFVYSELVVIAQSGVEFTLLSILVTAARPPDA